MKNKFITASFLMGSLFFSNYFAQTSDLEPKALTYLKQNARTSGISENTNLKLTSLRKSLSGETLRFNQFINNVPIYNGDVSIHFNKSQQVTYVAETVNKITGNINTTPIVTANQAYEKALSVSNPKGDITFSENKLYLFKNDDGNSHLVYRVIIISYENPGEWETMVDAHSGKILRVQDISSYFQHKEKPRKQKKNATEKIGSEEPILKKAGGTAYIFDPDPLSKIQVPYGGQYVDGNDATNAALDAARSLVNLIDINFANGVYTLKNNYATIADFESPNTGLFTQSTPNFLFNRNEQGFEAVNVFYHFDKSLRYINETLGILCKPTLNNGSVQFDPHGVNGSDNSHYVPSMQRLAFGEGCVDDAEDADVVLHELGHGIHHWITGLSSSSSQGLGEGSGDYWAMSYSRSLNQWPSSAPAYHWVFSWDGHNACWPGRVTNYPEVYPSGLAGSIHEDGQIWASTLMRIYDQIGKEKTDRIFLEGLSLTNSSANQQTAAVAVRQAAIDMLGTFGFTCTDINIITQEMTATGYTLPAYNCLMSVSETEKKDIAEIYPNPAKDILNVKLKSNIDGNAIIFNAEGRRIKEIELKKGSNSVNISELSSRSLTI